MRRTVGGELNVCECRRRTIGSPRFTAGKRRGNQREIWRSAPGARALACTNFVVSLRYRAS
jgi:hypothetical protein